MNLKGKVVKLKCTKCNTNMGAVVIASIGSTHQWIQSSYCPTCYAEMEKKKEDEEDEEAEEDEETDWEEHYGDHSEG